MFFKSNYFFLLKKKLIFIILCLIMIVFFNNSCDDDAKKNIIKNKLGNIEKINWQKSINDKGIIIIPGSVNTDFGKLELRWIIENNKKIRLVSLESPGSGELPPREKKILLFVCEDGSTILFQEWFSLVNAREPNSIRIITKVSTNDLFSVLPKTKIPPASPIEQKIYPITWGNITSKNNINFLEGATKASFGTLNIIWKKEADHIPELIILESPGAGELPSRESKLLLWMDKNSNITIICQERYPQLNQGYIPYLWCLTTVKTTDLLLGFNHLN